MNKMKPTLTLSIKLEDLTKSSQSVEKILIDSLYKAIEAAKLAYNLTSQKGNLPTPEALRELANFLELESKLKSSSNFSNFSDEVRKPRRFEGIFTDPFNPFLFGSDPRTEAQPMEQEPTLSGVAKQHPTLTLNEAIDRLLSSRQRLEAQKKDL